MNNYRKYELELDLDEFPFDEDDEDLDLPKKGNGEKSMLSLDIYKIVQNNSSPWKPLLIQDIVNILEQFPYDISVDRKAVSRHVHAIVQRYPDELHYRRNFGVWHEVTSPLQAG